MTNFTGNENVTINNGSFFRTTLTTIAAWIVSTYQGFTQSGTGAVARTVLNKQQERISLLDFGADPTGTADSYAAIMAFWAALKTSGKKGYIPQGTYKSATAIVWDMSGLGSNGVTVEGDGQRSTYFNLTGVTTSPAFMITKSDGAAFYSAFKGFGIYTNVAGVALQLGRTDFTDPLNSFHFSDMWIGNTNTSGTAVVQVNYVLATTFNNVVPAGNHSGDSWQINAASFCTWISGAATWGNYGFHLTAGGAGNGTIAGNSFIGVDHEENAIANVLIDTANAHNNVWYGGTFVYNPGTSYGVNATAGTENYFFSPNTQAYPSGTPSYANFFSSSNGCGLFGKFGMSVGMEFGNPSFSATLSASQTLATGTWTKVAFDTATWQGGQYSFVTTTNRFTAPFSGRFRFNACLSTNATNASAAMAYAALYKNGSNFRSAGVAIPAGLNYVSAPIDAVLYLNAGDYVECWANIPASSGSPVVSGGATSSYFECHYLG